MYEVYEGGLLVVRKIINISIDKWLWIIWVVGLVDDGNGIGYLNK